ncbi:unnamed protein product [Rhodiola kirilowii]
MQVTVAFNHFGQGLVQRMPRCRWGFIMSSTMIILIGRCTPLVAACTLPSSGQGNRFIAPHNAAAKEVTKRDYATQDTWKHWTWRSEGDLMMNGAFFVPSGSPLQKRYGRHDMIKAKPGTYASRLTPLLLAHLTAEPEKPC